METCTGPVAWKRTVAKQRDLRDSDAGRVAVSGFRRAAAIALRKSSVTFDPQAIKSSSGWGFVCFREI